ncbi:MAG: NRDE family protein [Desulfobacteraceae bacterium]|nr:MAG: NRDE family protein [Desulfobacteraceae bacterium]
MCLILFAYQVHPRYRLVLGANRDEFYARPTAPLEFWRDHPEVLAGRDLQQKGTWMGITRGGRLAALTNFRDPRALKTSALSRGQLVADFLSGHAPPMDYMQAIAATADRYNGFNLIVGDANDLLYFSSHGKVIRALGPGIYGLSNHLLDTPWPKIETGKQRLRGCINSAQKITPEAILELLQDQTLASDDRLPATGVDLAWERVLSPIFITSPDYGTRSSSVLMIASDGHIRFSERTWEPARTAPREQFTRYFELC